MPTINYTTRLTHRFVEDGKAVWKEADVQLTIEVDVALIAKVQGWKAVLNKTRRAQLGKGMVQVKAPKDIDWRPM